MGFPIVPAASALLPNNELLTWSVSGSSTSHQVTVPADPGVAPPGNRLLFALDAAGTPSVSAPIRIGGRP